MEYASKSVGTAGLTTGIIGTALGAASSGLLSGVLGTGRTVAGTNSGDLVTRETFDLAMKLASSESSNALLSAELNTEKKMVEVFNALNDKINNAVSNQAAINSAQAVTNCATTSTLAVAQNNIAQLMSLTKVVIPNANINPGWGDATVSVSTSTTTA